MSILIATVVATIVASIIATVLAAAIATAMINDRLDGNKVRHRDTNGYGWD
jgi:hypothetical protein